jgi:DNA transposition AAA+ family ATPase
MSDGSVQAELLDVAKRIRAWQQSHKTADGREITDSEMLRMFAGLGSTKTYTLIVSGEYDGDLERWLREYQAIWNLMQMMDESAAEDDPLYDDLTTVMDLRQAVAGAMREKGLNRLVIQEGPQGSGKSTAARMLAAKYGARIVIAEATQIWKENMNAMLSQLLFSMGVKVAPPSCADKFTLLVNKLSETRVCLVIDEAHHLGPCTLNLVKSLINQTPGEFVLLAMGTLWRRLETQAYEEAWQLTKNRLLERIRLSGVEVADVEKILERRLGMDGEARTAAQALAQAARNHGNMAFVKLVCRRARKLAGKAAVTAEHVARASALVAGSR